MQKHRLLCVINRSRNNESLWGLEVLLFIPDCWSILSLFCEVRSWNWNWDSFLAELSNILIVPVRNTGATPQIIQKASSKSTQDASTTGFYWFLKLEPTIYSLHCSDYILTALRHRQIWMLLPQWEMCLAFRHIASQYWKQESKTMLHAQSCSYVTAASLCQTCVFGYWLCGTHNCVAPRSLRTIRSIAVYLHLQSSAISRNGLRSESTIALGNCSDLKDQ